jgi:DNA-binding MarR family transcriptional regulator
MINGKKTNGSSVRKGQRREASAALGQADPETLVASSGFLLARLGMESRKRFARMMASHKLAMHHFGPLMALGEDGMLPQLQLSRVMGVDPRNAVPIIDELEKRKLIERRPDPSDRRRYNVCITQAGRQLLQAIRQSGGHLEEEFFKFLSNAERAALHSLLLKLYLGLDRAN